MFAQFVSPFLHEDKVLIELGCGNGRDSVYLSNEGPNVLAFDQCSKEMDHLNESRGGEKLEFRQGDFTNLDKDLSCDYLYSRFSLHAVDLEAELRTFEWAKNTLRQSGLFFIEVRSTLDPLYGQGENVAEHAFVTDHYRRFTTKEDILERAKNSGFKVLYQLQSTGLAPYGDSDPSIIRLILERV